MAYKQLTKRTVSGLICAGAVGLGLLASNVAKTDDNTDASDLVSRIDLGRLKAWFGGGPIVTKANKDGWQPIHLAAEASKTELVRRLLDAGVSVKAAQRKPDPKDVIAPELESGDLPLHCAARSGSVETVQLLLDAGANVDAMNRMGYAPLYSAVKAGKFAVVSVLLKAGARPDKPYSLAELSCGIRVETGLLTHVAAREGHLEILKLLMKTGCPLSASYEWHRGAEPERPIQLAVGNGHTDIVEFLLSRNGNSKKKTLYPEEMLTSLLCSAVEQNHAAAVETLLDAGADPQGTQPFQVVWNEPIEDWQPIHYAAWNSHDGATVKLLLESGASPTATLSNGKQPLHLAARIEQSGAIRELLAAGALPTAKAKDGQTPIQVAQKAKRSEALKLLIPGNN